MAIEFHVPDLPALALGADEQAPPPPRVRQPWHWVLRETLSAYLPILLMALLALSTWWLVKNTPLPLEPIAAAALRHEPDYTMQRFLLHRFGPDGRMRVQLEGEQLRHYPDTDTLEIDTVRIRMISPEGGVTLATAKQAIANGDATEVQLLGGAHVTSEPPDGGDTIEFRGEFLHAFLATEKLRSHLPVTVRRGGSEMQAAGMEYDNLTRIVQLKGRVRATFLPTKRS